MATILFLIISVVSAAPKVKPVPPAKPPKCYTETDVKDEGCRTLCIRDGYTGGKSHKKGCSCFVIKESVEDFAARRVALGRLSVTTQERKEGMVAKTLPPPPWYYEEPAEYDESYDEE